MPLWIMKIVHNWLLNKTTSLLAAEIKADDPAIVPALRKYREGASFLEIVEVYITATENKDDDAIAAGFDEFQLMLETMPFNEVLPKLTGSIGAIRIPDGDGDPSNDVTVAEVLSKVVDKVLAE